MTQIQRDVLELAKLAVQFLQLENQRACLWPQFARHCFDAGHNEDWLLITAIYIENATR
jgi:hypothetical protein